MKLLELLHEPPREFTPIPFWFLNGRLTHDELRRQLRDFCAHGVYGVVLHPRLGLSEDIEYLSDGYFAYIRTAVEEAAALDMRVVLYDEGMYPSGSACGLVVKDHPHLASRGLGLVDEPLPGDTLLARTARGCLVERFSGGTLRGLHYGEDDGEPNAPRSADILNPEAVDRFIALTHEAYWRALKPFFGNTVIGFFTDEPSILGRNVEGLQPWTAGFADLFRAAGGRPEGLAGLFTGEENDDTRLYRDLILRRECDVYYGKLSAWCQAHGIALMGHPHQSDDIEVQRYFHVPGQDLVYRWVGPETGGTNGMDSTMGKCGADAARLSGRRRNSNECFGACNRDDNPWYFTGGDMKWFIDWLAVRGVNLFIPHAFYYSLEGQRSAERPPDVGPGSHWWPWYEKWSRYMARLSCLMTDARLCADIAVLCRNRDLRAEAVKPLFETQRDFVYLPESAWADCAEKDGVLTCRGLTFRAVAGEGDRFPGVSHDPMAAAPACRCDPPCPDLRVTQFYRADRRCWLLVNEGERDDLTATVTLPADAPIGAYDLWEGRACRVHAEAAPGGVRLSLRLPYRGSLLLFACATEGEWRALEEAPRPAGLPVPPFTLTEDDPEHIRRAYEADFTYDAPVPEDGLLLTVRAEEMARLWVNGVECGLSFWSPHRFAIPKAALRPGKNHCRLEVTGSLANRYGRPVEYGLSE